ncbi:hypothetical protein ACWDOR_01030 [Streptosporangium canum]|uniref:hypothetical protein n=1 Tax=Streptosporangium canum TaxID=324952 RepID=UPI0036968C24
MVRFIGRERELGLLREWNQGEGMWAFLERALTDPTSPLLVSAERSLAAEFPKQAIAKDVLGVIGSGERTFSNISRACGGLSAATATRSLELLTARQAVAAELPALPMIAVSRSGVTAGGLAAAYGPEDLLHAWK